VTAAELARATPLTRQQAERAVRLAPAGTDWDQRLAEAAKLADTWQDYYDALMALLRFRLPGENIELGTFH